MSECPCGSGKQHAECCEPFIKGTAKPATALQLMRARYTAFATGNVKFIWKTILPAKRTGFDEKATREWSVNSVWHGFEVKNTDAGGEEDARGSVEFVATFTSNDHLNSHHEIAEFKKHNGRWYFADGTMVAQKPFVRSDPRIGRNDPCPCGSGKKFKKCCALKPA